MAQDIKRPRGAARFAAMAAGVAAVTAALYFFVDAPLARWIAVHERALDNATRFILDGAREYGQGFCVLAVAAAMMILDPERKKAAVKILVAIVLTAVVVHLAKSVLGRARPGEFIETGGAWEFLRGFKGSRYCSFPSAHAASAFALSAALAVVYPRGAWLFFTFAALCGLNRVVTMQHFPSDVVAGAALGAWIGRGAFRWRWADRLAGALAPPYGRGRAPR